jgi:hypothetical protein
MFPNFRTRADRWEGRGAIRIPTATSVPSHKSAAGKRPASSPAFTKNDLPRGRQFRMLLFLKGWEFCGKGARSGSPLMNCDV